MRVRVHDSVMCRNGNERRASQRNEERVQEQRNERMDAADKKFGM